MDELTSYLYVYIQIYLSLLIKIQQTKRLFSRSVYRHVSFKDDESMFSLPCVFAGL